MELIYSKMSKISFSPQNETSTIHHLRCGGNDTSGNVFFCDACIFAAVSSQTKQVRVKKSRIMSSVFCYTGLFIFCSQKNTIWCRSIYSHCCDQKEENQFAMELHATISNGQIQNGSLPMATIHSASCPIDQPHKTKHFLSCELGQAPVNILKKSIW